MCRRPPCVVIAEFITEVLFIVIGIPIRILESITVSAVLQYLIISLVNDWPSAFGGFIYGFVLSNMALLPLAHYFVFQSPGLCTFYMSWVMWIVGQLARAFVAYAREVPGIQQSCITSSRLCRTFQLRKPSAVGYTGLLAGLLFASPIATPVLPGIEPIIDRVQFCKPLLDFPLWILCLTVFAASYITAGVAIQKLAVPAFAGQERVPGEEDDRPMNMFNAQEADSDDVQLQPLTHVQQFGALEPDLDASVLKNQ